MAPSEPPTSITLRIKIAPGHIPGDLDEFTLGTNVPTSVPLAQVRQRIQQVVPSNPAPDRQRLLYCGRALIDNEQSLADALNTKRDPSQTEYVVHLLVRGSDGLGAGSASHRSALNTPGRSTSPDPARGSGRETPGPLEPGQAQAGGPPQLHHMHHLHHHHLAGQHMQQFRFPHQMIHGQHPMAGFTPFGGMPPNFGVQMPANMPGVPQMGPGMQPPQSAPGLHVLAEGTANSSRPTARASTVSQDQDATATTAASAAATAGGDNGGGAPPIPDQQQSAQSHNAEGPPNGHGVYVQGVGPNGQRFAIHQQTLNVPHFGFHGVGSPSGLAFPGPGGPGPTNTPQFPPPSPAAPTVSDIINQLNALQSAEDISDEQRQHIIRLRDYTQRLGDSAGPMRQANQVNGMQRAPALLQPLGAQQQIPQNLANITYSATTGAPINGSSSDVTCYLLSSPTGPRAILYSRAHGLFTGARAAPTFRPAPTDGRMSMTPTPTTPLLYPERTDQPPAPAGAPANVEEGQAAPVAVQQVAEPDPMGPMGPVMGPIMANFWLIMRVLIFIYFLLGSNMGWRRPLVLGAMGLGFWMMRIGLFGDGGVLRRWWDGIVQVPQAPARENGQGTVGEGRQNAEHDHALPDTEQQQQPQQPQEPNARPVRAPGQMPTPAEVAQRLLDEDERARNHAQQARFQRLRERVRPAERAAALFVASLWPGVGEAHVRAREQEERRRAEEEIAARRREEEERQQREEEDRKDGEEGNDESLAVDGKTQSGAHEATLSASPPPTSSAASSENGPDHHEKRD